MKDDKEPTPQNQTTAEGGKHTSNYSMTRKLILIVGLAILFLIPIALIHISIKEKQQANIAAVKQLNNRWAKYQVINGPVLNIPLIYKNIDSADESDELERTVQLKVLPKKLDISGKINSKQLEEGIHQSMVYQSDFEVSGKIDLNGLIDTTNLIRVDDANAYLTIGINDLKGIKNTIKVKVNHQSREANAGTAIPELIPRGIKVNLKGALEENELKFSYQLQLNGSKEVEFVPIGEHTTVNISSDWVKPSFKGTFFPDREEQGEEGFTAEWDILPINKNLPTSWEEGYIKQQLKNTAFGVNLSAPKNNLEKSAEAAEFAMLSLIVVFLFFILVELLGKRSIHPVQYVLVGIVLCLFHLLLLSAGEHINFPMAYGISGIVAVVLISLYSLKVFKERRLALLLFTILSGLFSCLFISLQLANVSLLIGGYAAIFLIAIIMYISRNFDWYQLKTEVK